MPPVLRPMRSVSSMKDSVEVPIWVSERQKRGTSGSSRAGTGRRSKAACGGGEGEGGEGRRLQGGGRARKRFAGGFLTVHAFNT